MKKVKNIYIPKNIREINNAFFPKSLIEIEVDQENISYASIDGILYKKSITEIWKYPAKRNQSEYKIQSGVKFINERTFQGNKYLTKIVIPDNIKEIHHQAFTECKNLQSIIIPSSLTFLG